MKGIPEFILSKIAEILDCYDKETAVAEGFLSSVARNVEQPTRGS